MVDVDWTAWQAAARPPLAYDPPQLRPGYIGTCPHINWYGLRSPVCCGPPCALLTCPEHTVRLTDVGTYAELMRGVDPRCPDEYVGVFWLRDLTQSSSLITLHDASWDADGRGGTKRIVQNWVKANTCYGAASACSFRVGDAMGLRLRFDVSPNRAWILFSWPSPWPCCAECGPRQWVHVFRKGATLTTPDGTPIRIRPGDMMRIDHATWDDPSSPLTYYYLVQRVFPAAAVHQDALAELVRRAGSRTAEPCVVCDPDRRAMPTDLAPVQHTTLVASRPMAMSRC